MGFDVTAPFEKRAQSAPTSASVLSMDQQKEFEFIPVPAEAIPLWWHRIEKLYKETPETWSDYETLENIYNQHLAGTRLLWITLCKMEVHFAISGTVQTWPKGRQVVLDWCAGKDTEKFMGLALSHLEDLARQVDAMEIQFIGREGWKRPLAKFGYSVSHTIYSKKLTSFAPRRV